MITVTTENSFESYNGTHHRIFEKPIELVKYIESEGENTVYLESEELHRFIAYLLRLDKKLFIVGNRESIFSANMGKITFLPINQVIPYGKREREILGEARGVIGDYRAIEKINSLVSPFQIGQSVGSTAFSLLEVYLEKTGILLDKLPTGLHKLIRKSYYGGRTEIFKKSSQNGVIYDINSSYLNCMTEKFPVGKYSTGKELTEFSIVCATVEVDETNYIGLLPYRLKTANTPDRLYFPVGTWTAYFTGVELQNALNYGLKIHKIHFSANWETGDYIFADFANWLYAARYNETITPLLGRFIKLMGNSVAGKLAQDYNTYRLKHGTPGKGWYSVANINNLWACPVQYVPPSAYYQHGAYITSYGRIKLLKALKDSINVSYCDTDSVFCSRFSGIEGTGLGEWKRVARYSNLHILTGKQYSYQNFDTGEWKHTKHFQNIEHFNQYFYGNVKLQPSEQKLYLLAHSRHVLPDGETIPYNVDEIKRCL